MLFLLGDFMNQKMQDTIVSDLKIFAHEIALSRPRPYREYDQIYMFEEDLVKHVYELISHVKSKKIVFMGDGDGVSILLALITHNMVDRPISIVVFDFDERILNTYRRISEKYGLTHIQYVHYNIIEPLPKKYIGVFNYFCINPPYGSKNAGLSCILWLRRCIDACNKEGAGGCIVYPNSLDQEWSVRNTQNILQFLKQNGFYLTYEIHAMHRYHLADNPTLKSSAFFIDSIKDVNTKSWNDIKFTTSETQNLYGDERIVPHYIWDDGTTCGIVDTKWE